MSTTTAELTQCTFKGEYESVSTLPNFKKLFPRVKGEDRWSLTPRTAHTLHTAMQCLGDFLYDDCEELGGAPVAPTEQPPTVLARLPRLTWRQGVMWRRLMARSADDLWRDIESGRLPVPRNHAEEICLHLAIEDAEGDVNETQSDENHEALPSRADDYDWSACRDYLFQDHDILQLYNPAHDGVEDPDDPTNSYMKFGDMRPTAWFEWFANVEPRNPDRGFRR